MGRKKAAVEERVKKAARLCISNPNLPVPKAMLAEQFTLEESKDKTQQMKVCRCIKALGGKAKHNEVPDVVAVTRNDLASPLTNSSTDDNTSASASKSAASSKSSAMKKAAGIKAIQKTSSQAQQARVNNKKIKDLQSRALKEATAMYEEEKAKDKDGLSARKVCDIVNKRLHTNLQCRQVQRYAKNGMIGKSPVRRGPTGRSE